MKQYINKEFIKRNIKTMFIAIMAFSMLFISSSTVSAYAVGYLEEKEGATGQIMSFLEGVEKWETPPTCYKEDGTADGNDCYLWSDAKGIADMGDLGSYKYANTAVDKNLFNKLKWNEEWEETGQKTFFSVDYIESNGGEGKDIEDLNPNRGNRIQVLI